MVCIIFIIFLEYYLSSSITGRDCDFILYNFTHFGIIVRGAFSWFGVRTFLFFSALIHSHYNDDSRHSIPNNQLHSIIAPCILYSSDRRTLTCTQYKHLRNRILKQFSVETRRQSGSKAFRFLILCLMYNYNIIMLLVPFSNVYLSRATSMFRP